MRNDLDSMRERFVLREVREESSARMRSGDWGWVRAFAATTKPNAPAGANGAPGQEPPRPGTPDGGF